MKYRIEKDTMGEVQVPADKYWGAQTERSRNNFKIGPSASMPKEIIEGFAYLKKAAAYANCDLGVLPIEKRDAIAAVCDEILAGSLADEFPLVIWQTGSGTQSNMNVNEVIANRAQVIKGFAITSFTFILLCVPEPVCQITSGNSLARLPARISSQTAAMASRFSVGRAPKSQLA